MVEDVELPIALYFAPVYTPIPPVATETIANVKSCITNNIPAPAAHPFKNFLFIFNTTLSNYFDKRKQEE